MADDDAEANPSIEDRIVAEFGEGHDVEAIAARYGLTVAQVYAVIQREVGPPAPLPPNPYPAAGYYPPQPPPGYYPPQPPPGYYPPQPPPAYYPAQPPPGYYYPPQPPPGSYAAPSAYGPPGYYAPPQAYQAPPQAYPPLALDEDAIVAEYGEGYAVEAIAGKRGLSVDQVYEIVQRSLANDQPPATGDS